MIKPLENKLLSVVVPLFNEEKVINRIVDTLQQCLGDKEFGYEIILVNDGSVDSTLSKAKQLCENNNNIKLLSFSRNFGHQIAATAGLDHAHGDMIVIIDADMQDPPELILKMIEKWQEGFDVVYAVREKREGETFFKLVTARLFYRLLRKLTEVEIPIDTGDFRLMDRKVVDQLVNMKERHRFLRGMVSWVGFKQGQVKYVRQKRYAGDSKYPLLKMIKFALDGILSFSHLPLKIATFAGILSSITCLFLIMYGIFIKIFYPGNAIPGWASLFTVVLFYSGIQLLTLGILGEYIGRMSDEIKKRPLYIIEESHNFDK